ncbi:hypothetical protein BC628DRAFT_633214 [Trametes gibbosa]|nr:hypothetical protein BC628DRAFT_633214 [Trametes gibbosa]
MEAKVQTMNSHGVQDLPREIFHIILDYLGSNKPILRSCSLVCRSWLQASRPRLFAIVSLYACEQRLVGFLEFLGTHPDIPNHVRSLMLHKPMDEQPPGVSGTLDASLTPSTLARTTRALPRLRECQLYFVHIVNTVRCPNADSAQSASLVDLSVLHIFGSAHQEIGPFLEMLAYFRIDRLELELVSFDPCPMLSSDSQLGRVHIRDLWADLETVDDSPVAILSALAPALSPGVLQTFHCNWREWSGCEPVGAFLRTVGHSLADLELNMSVPSWVEDKGSASRYSIRSPRRN